MNDSETLHILTNFLTQDELDRFKQEIKDDVKYSYEYKEYVKEYEIKVDASKDDIIKYHDLFADLLFLEETKLGSAVGWRRFEDFYKEQIMDFMEV